MTKLAFAGYDIDVVPRPLFWYRSEVGGRLQTLAGDPARAFRLRTRMVEAILADVELERRERIQLWECLLAAASPSDELAEMQRLHDEVAEWAQEALAETNAWHERHFSETEAWWAAQLEQARAEAAGRPWPPPAQVPVRELWRQALRRTGLGLRRRGERVVARSGG